MKVSGHRSARRAVAVALAAAFLVAGGAAAAGAMSASFSGTAVSRYPEQAVSMARERAQEKADAAGYTNGDCRETSHSVYRQGSQYQATVYLQCSKP